MTDGRTQKVSFAIALVAACSYATLTFAQQAPQGQPPAGGRGGGGGGARLSVTSTSFPDGGEIPARYSSVGEGNNKSPAFEFHWMVGNNPGMPPAALQSYAVILHDIENAGARGTADTLHWTAFNIPGTATGLPEGIGPATLPDGTVNGPGLATRGGNPTGYYGPGAGVGPFHHYIFEFYALDTKLDLPMTATRDDLMKALEGHVIGKAAYVGRYHAPNP